MMASISRPFCALSDRPRAEITPVVTVHWNPRAADRNRDLRAGGAKPPSSAGTVRGVDAHHGGSVWGRRRSAERPGGGRRST
jgi:hypothetical protein